MLGILFPVAAGILLALKLAGIAAVSWWIIIAVALGGLLIVLGIALAGVAAATVVGAVGMAVYAIGALGKALGKRLR